MIIRGQDTGLPLLLFLHGGPGMPEGGMLRKYAPELEKLFVVVDWEQRGAGLTGAEKTPVESLTIEQLAADTVELTRYLLQRFSRERLYLFAHSFGTVIAVRALQQAPELYTAYIGAGQIVNQIRAEQLGYAFLLKEAERRGDRKALEQLRSVAFPQDGLYVNEKYPENYKAIAIPRKWLGAYGGVTRDPAALRPMLMACVFTPEHSLLQALSFMGRFRRAMNVVWPQVMQYDLLASATRLEVPVHLIAGRYDMDTPSSLVEEYFHALEAPRRELYWFESSAHLAPFEQPVELYRVFREQVLPQTAEAPAD